MNIGDQDNISTDGYQESLAQHVAPGDQFIRAQTDRKLQMKPAAKQALEQIRPVLEDQQDFGWLDKILERFKGAINPDAYMSKSTAEAKAAIQAHLTAQNHIVPGNNMVSQNQHQAELLRARINEIEYPAAVRAYEAGFGVSEYESFLTKEERARCKKLQAELDKLDGEDS